ncbi:MAG TPA: phosphatidate cytidylyltransferase [Thermoanaerobaculaceae bacterium]|nr:phosphatidate cytidylyltransferase [Thermoanaerobaculaceae bacterium]HRS15224.1 phosphatidate cytidylyltransferase [Thermoanaerobaculaceae bacterium]
MTTPPMTPVLTMSAVVLGLLVLSTLAVWLLRRWRPAGSWDELSARVRAWWVMAAVFLCAVAVHPVVSLVFFALMSFWALKEYVTLLKTRPHDHATLFWAFAAVPAQYWLVHVKWYGVFIIFVPVYMFLLLPVTLVLARETKGFVASASQIHWGLMAFVFGLSHLGYLLQLPALPGRGVDGRALVLFVVFVVEMSDVLQYVWGKLFGRHKVLPSVSPNKTWEGLVGGVLSAALLALPLRFLTPFSPLETAFVALGVCIAGFLGGAVMSAVKRDFGVKDFGTLIPGHGGMLDRVDSLCWAVPLFFHYVYWAWY